MRVGLRHQAAAAAIQHGWHEADALVDGNDRARYAVARSLRSVDPVAASALAAGITSRRLARRWVRRSVELRGQTAAVVMLSGTYKHAVMAGALCEVGCEVMYLAPQIEEPLVVWVKLRRRGLDTEAAIVRETRRGSAGAPWPRVLWAWWHIRSVRDERFVVRFALPGALWFAVVSRRFAEAWAHEAIERRTSASLAEVCRFPGLAGRVALRRAGHVDGLPRMMAGTTYGRLWLAGRLGLEPDVAGSIGAQFPGSVEELVEILAR